MKFKYLNRPGVLFSSLVFAAALLFMSSLSLALEEESDESQGFRLTYDISASIGSATSSTTTASGPSTITTSYTEISVGLNSFFSDWFVWRNSGFTRMGQGFDGTYGLDSSARFLMNLGDSSLGLNAFAGPGYRVIINQSGTNQMNSAPFAEAGAVLRLGGLNLGGGVKSVFNSLIRDTDKDDVQYFFTLSGGGAI